MPLNTPRSWYLLADIGGTNARFAVGDPVSGELCEIATIFVADHPTFTAALRSYLSRVEASGQWAPQPDAACLAVACPVDRAVVTFTNSDWVIDRKDLAFTLGVRSLKVINDFAALGHAVAGFNEDDWEQVGDGAARPGKPLGVIGPGTGLGVCTVLPGRDGARVLAGEGGHVDFSPVGDEELEILRLLLSRYRRVSAERVLSGAGIQNIYWALTQRRGVPRRQATPADISAAALAGDDPVAVETLAVFCRVLGGVAGNLALTVGAHGGIYITGGIAPRVLPFLRRSEFRERFLTKGRFRDYLSDIPTRVVTRENAGLFGALKFLQSGC
ncbi:MAG: glucokinase [Chromatocurvus sp.]